jgi:cyclic pyranopterin phosphate synthase
MALYDIYTDGSCSGNPGPGGWGAIVVSDGTKTPLSGGELKTTNNRMEVMAAIEGLVVIPEGSAVTVHSDSTYLVNTMTKGWKRNANPDLWTRLDRVAAERSVKWEWVRGHNGHPLNEAADRLAILAMSRFNGGSMPSRPPIAPSGGAPDDPSPFLTLTHLDAQGNANMVDVGDKPDSVRTAVASGTITMHPETLAIILQGKVKKGDVFTVARMAGINAAKHTWELIPLAHQIPLSHIAVDFTSDSPAGKVTITGSTRTTAKTGVEMEALTAVSVAGLTIYDMCKAVDRTMVMGEVRLVEKRGGTHGDYSR